MLKTIQVLSKKTMYHNDISKRNHFNFTCNYFTNNCNIELKYADYFLSRKDHYINSRYELFTKKLGWFVSAFFTSLFITFKILETLMKSK